MSVFLGGGRGKGPSRINDLAVQTSSRGVAVPRGWGTGRVKTNLLWYGDFKSISRKEKAGGGKGAPKTTSYSYTCSFVGGLCSGPISQVLTVYKDKSATSLSESSLSLALGELGQAVWPYLLSSHPTEALGYSGISYVYAANYDLTDSASLPNHSFEVEFISRASGLPDANPQAIVEDILTDPYTGIRGWEPAMLGDLSDYGNYCLASGLLLSPVLENQTKASEFIESQVIEPTNSWIFWSEGKLKIRPLGDQEITGNGTTWTPDLTPVYDLDESDFLSPPQQEILDKSEAYNRVEVEYLDRANQYNTAIVSAHDLSDIIDQGERKEDTTSIHSICVADVATIVANLRLKRKLYLRDRWKFKLPDKYSLLEQGDIVTLTTTMDGLQLNRKPVRIREINEDSPSSLSIVAEPLISDMASTALYSSPPNEGYIPDSNVAPGSVTSPSIINAPLSLTQGRPEVWIAASSTSPTWGGCEVWTSSDGDNYTYVGVIDQPGRYGTLTSVLSPSLDPQPAGTFGVNLSNSRGVLIPVTDEARDVGATLSMVGGELISYRDATLTAPNTYSLANLRRGLYGTSSSIAHPIGSPFLRLDEDLLKLPYNQLGLGSQAYFKFLSYNVWGKSLQSLASVTEYSITLLPLSSGIFNLGSYSIVASPQFFFDQGKLTKLSGVDDWVDQAYSPEGLVSAASLSFTLGTSPGGSGDDYVVGLNDSPLSSVSWEDIDFGVGFNGTTLTVYSSGTGEHTESANPGDRVSIRYLGDEVKYYLNEAVIHTVSTTANQTLYMDSSFYKVGSFIDSINISQPGPPGVSPVGPGTTIDIAIGANQTTIVLPADLQGNITDYSLATGTLTLRDSDGLDISSHFTLSTESNPQGLTVTPYSGMSWSVTGGFDAGEGIATLVIKATGSGDWSGRTSILTLSFIKNQIPIAAALLAGENGTNVLTPTAPAFTSGISIVRTFDNGNVSLAASFTSLYSNDITDPNSFNYLELIVHSSPSSTSYPFDGSEPQNERKVSMIAGHQASTFTNYSFVDNGPANMYYQFSVRKVRPVNPGLIVGDHVYSARAVSNRFQPSASQNYTGNIGGTSAASIASAVANFNADNDRNTTTPPAAAGVSITSNLNTDGSADLTIQWTYTNSLVQTAANNIDGFIVGLYPGSGNITYNPATHDAQMMWQPPVTADVRKISVPAVACDRSYTAVIIAYRRVNGDVNSTGNIRSAAAQNATAFLPSAAPAYSGNVGGQSATNVANATSRGLVALNADGTVATGKVLTGSIDPNAINLASYISEGASTALLEQTGGDIYEVFKSASQITLQAGNTQLVGMLILPFELTKNNPVNNARYTMEVQILLKDVTLNTILTSAQATIIEESWQSANGSGANSLTRGTLTLIETFNGLIVGRNYQMGMRATVTSSNGAWMRGPRWFKLDYPLASQ